MGTYTDWVDWRRFIIERSAGELIFRIENLHAVEKSTILEDHAAHHPPLDPIAVGGIDGWRLAEKAEIWGLSLFPRWFSCAARKPFWMSELQGRRGNKGLWHGHKTRPQDTRLWNWLAVAFGAYGLIYWTYHAEAIDGEATGFGLVTRGGEPTERVTEAALDNHLIQQHSATITSPRPKCEIAILTDPDSTLLTYGTEQSSTRSFRGYYCALWNIDLSADFIQPHQLADVNYKVIIAPWHLVGKAATCKALVRLVKAGCTLILETSTGLFDERFFANPVVPPHGLAEEFGYREGESFYIPSENDKTIITSASIAQAL